MASYTSETRLAAHYGSDVISAIQANAGIVLATMISDASDVVAGYLRNSGYSAPSTSNPDTIADKTICLACDALVIQALSRVPEANLPLPDGWQNSMQMVALNGILSGSVQLSLTPSSISAVGGSAFSVSDPAVSVADGSRPQRASRAALEGW